MLLFYVLFGYMNVPIPHWQNIIWYNMYRYRGVSGKCLSSNGLFDVNSNTIISNNCQLSMGSYGSGSDLRVSVQYESSFILVDGVVREGIDNTKPVQRRAGCSSGECAVPASIAQYTFCSHIVIDNSVPMPIKCFPLFICRDRLHGDLKFADFPLIANTLRMRMSQTCGSLTPFHFLLHGINRFHVFFSIYFPNKFFLL